MRMTEAIDLKPQEKKQVINLITQYLPNTTVWAFGSRVKFTSRPDSDLDLVAFTKPDQQVQVSKLKEAFEESDLPFRVDFLEWDAIPENFKKNIENNKLVFIFDDVVHEELQSIAEIIDFNPNRRLPANTILPFIDMAALSENCKEIASKSQRLYTGSGSKFKNGDTLFARITPCLENGKTAKVSGLDKDCHALGSTEFIVMAAKDFENDSDFIYYLARSPDFRKYAESRMEGSSGRQRVSWQALSEYKCFLPRKAERKKIAIILSTLDDKIALNRTTNQTLEQIAQALFKSWFIDFNPVHAKAAGRQPVGMDDATTALFPDSFEESELGMIPTGWEVKTLKDVTSKIGSGATPRGGQDVYISEGISLIRSQNIYDSFFAWNGLAHISSEAAEQLSNVTVKKYDVLINITGASILRTCIVDSSVIPARVNQHVSIVRSKNGVPPGFIYLHLLQKSTKELLLGMNAGASREAITKGHLESVPIVLSLPGVLIAFNKVISSIFDYKDLLAKQARELSTIRDSLLPRLLSGEIDISEYVRES